MRVRYVVIKLWVIPIPFDTSLEKLMIDDIGAFCVRSSQQINISVILYIYLTSINLLQVSVCNVDIKL